MSHLRRSIRLAAVGLRFTNTPHHQNLLDTGERGLRATVDEISYTCIASILHPSSCLLTGIRRF